MTRILLLNIFLFSIITGFAQQNDTLQKQKPKWFHHTKPDTSANLVNMDAVYNRPFMQFGKIPVSLGGYVETNTSYFRTKGRSEGWSFQIPRLTLFISSSIKNRIKFLSEIEFEEGGKEINIEFASIDVEFHPLANLRAGIVMNPIGSFNQNHDGPKWEFVNRPLSSTTIIPSTWSCVGFGLFGKYARNNWVWAYEVYATNGFDDKIISNGENRTWMPASKDNGERFNESFNGSPLITAKVAVKHRNIGELGISWMGGVYNKFNVDGIRIDSKRRADLIAVDFNTTLPKIKTYINAEYVTALINVPSTYSQQFGSRQQGFYCDVVQPLLTRKIWNWDNSTLSIAFRTEYVDYNVGKFTITGGNIADHIVAISPAISFRPIQQTVLRVNYRYEWHTDILGNPPVETMGFQIGISSYF
jgi:hypothetical protein